MNKIKKILNFINDAIEQEAMKHSKKSVESILILCDVREKIENEFIKTWNKKSCENCSK